MKYREDSVSHFHYDCINCSIVPLSVYCVVRTNVRTKGISVGINIHKNVIIFCVMHMFHELRAMIPTFKLL